MVEVALMMQHWGTAVKLAVLGAAVVGTIGGLWWWTREVKGGRR